MNHTIFDDIVSGKMKSWKIWEDEKFLAFYCGDSEAESGRLRIFFG